jgi:RsiW-degrading membrane proteinase PrsW (M82 family)
MRRFVAPIITGAITLGSIIVLLAVPAGRAGVELGGLVVAAAGGPLTIFLVVQAVADPDRKGRSPWVSFFLGATLVPFLVILLHGLFYGIGFVLVEPLFAAGIELFDELKADPGYVEVLTSFWAYLLIVELAVVAPLAEETTKPLGSVIRRPTTARDAFVFGAAAGTGFAVVENILYASGWFLSFDFWLPVSVIRILGSALHPFGAALVSWAVFRLRAGDSGRWAGLALAYGLAFAAHALWNGTIAVTQVLYAGRSELGSALSDDAVAWGIGLLSLLTVLGIIVAGGLILAARQIREDDDPVRPALLADLGRPAGITAWAMVSTMLLIPAAIVVLVFPALIAL